MKTTVFAIFFYFLAAQCFALEWFAAGTAWHYGWNLGYWNGYEEIPIVLVSTETEMVNGHECRLIEREGDEYGTATQRVYVAGDTTYIYHSWSNSFEILFIWNLEVGEGYSEDNDEDSIMVTAVSWVDYGDGIVRRVQHCIWETCAMKSPTSFEIIEGIGLTQNFELFADCYFDSDFPTGLKCFQSPGHVSAQLVEGECEIPSQIQESTSNPQIIYNPESQVLSVTDFDKNIQLINFIEAASGRVVQTIIRPGNNIQLKEIKLGIFILVIYTEDDIQIRRVVL